MAREDYTNWELAQDYFSVVAQYGRELGFYTFQKRKIVGLDVDLVVFYRKHESLEELGVKGIGKKTRGILELILDKGVEEAKMIIRKRRIEEDRTAQWSRKYRRVSPKHDKPVPGVRI